MERYSDDKAPTKIEQEAQFFSDHDNRLTRATAWNSVPYFQEKMRSLLDLKAEALELLAGRQEIRALTIACGDMAGEYRFLRALGAVEIDAYDVAIGKRDEFFNNIHDGKATVNYEIADANELLLPASTYDIVYMQQSLHHIEQVDHLTQQISQALKPSGAFLLNDYVGPNFLQRSSKQLAIASKIWSVLPERLRINPQGIVKNEVFVPRKEWLSPYEAINSEAILPELNKHFSMTRVALFGGLLFPVFNGFAQNYGEMDELFIHTMWELDQHLIQEGLIEPNFIRALLRPAHFATQ